MAALLAPFLGGDVLSDAQLSQLSAYLDLLLRWNARINLTSVRDPEQIVARHFGESLFAARNLYPPGSQPATGAWQLDVGSGAGFPGLPIKIWTPALPVTLIESIYRKAIFLREVIRALALPAIDVFPGRAEDFDVAQRCGPPAPGRENAGKVTGSVGPGAPAGAAPDLSASQVARAPSPATIGNRQSAIDNLTITLRAVEQFDRVLPVAARLLDAAPDATRRLALLIGDAQVPRARQLLPGFSWSDPVAIPQSSHRRLLLGVSNG